MLSIGVKVRFNDIFVLLYGNVVDSEESTYVPIEELLAIRNASGPPVDSVRIKTPAELEPKKRKRLFIDEPVIIKGKRSVKNPFTDYVEAPVSRRSFGGPDDVALSEQKEGDEDAVVAAADGNGNGNEGSDEQPVAAEGGSKDDAADSSQAEVVEDDATKKDMPIADPTFTALKFITSGEPFMELVIEAVKVLYAVS